MYAISSDCRNALKAPALKEHIRGTIGNVSFTEENVLLGSLNVTNQCGASNGIILGSVYVGQFRCTFVDVNISQTNWEGLWISLEIGIEVGLTIEYVPVGEFKIDSAVWSAVGVSVIAYDAMGKFDIELPRISMTDTPYNLISAACTACGVTMAQQDFTGFPNAEKTFRLYDDNDLVSWRDFVSAVAQLIGAFCTINRDGDFEVRAYPSVSNYVDTVDEDERLKDCSFSDFQTKYIGVSFVDMASKETKIYTISGTGTIYEMGANPFMQGLTQTQYTAILTAVMGALANIAYTPCTVLFREAIQYDLGDVVKSLEGIISDSYFCVMSYVYKQGENMTIQTYGKDPSLAVAKGRSDRYLNGVQSSIYMNTQSIEELRQSALRFLFPNEIDDSAIADGSSNDVITWFFDCAEDAEVAVHVTLGFEVTTTFTQDALYGDAVLTATLKLDDLELISFSQTYGDGYRVLTVSYIDVIPTAGIHTLVLEISMNGGGIE